MSPKVIRITAMDICRRYIVSGVVQGVGFRYHTQRQGQGLGLSGWVHNRADGDVELLAYGEPDRLEQLYNWLLRGPSMARVSGVRVEEMEVDEELAGFSIR